MLKIAIARTCPNCRKERLRRFEQALPRVGAEAAELAAMVGSEDHFTCH
jgi:hypothetical protein